MVEEYENSIGDLSEMIKGPEQSLGDLSYSVYSSRSHAISFSGASTNLSSELESLSDLNTKLLSVKDDGDSIGTNEGEGNPSPLPKSKATTYDLSKKKDQDAIESFLKNPYVSIQVKKDTLSNLDAVNDETKNILNAAIRCGVPNHLIKLIIGIEPGILTAIDKYGFSPMHSACAENASYGVVELLADKVPLESFVSLDNEGDTPLHLACANKATPAVIQLLLGKTPPEILLLKNKGNKTPLHLACVFQAHIGVIKLLLEKTPTEALNFKDNDGRTPLHSVCVNQAPLEVGSLLLRRTLPGNAFHVSWANKAYVEVVRILLLKTPEEALISKDKKGCIPFHLACTKAPFEVVELILKKTPTKVFNSRDKQGYTAFRSACFYKAPAEVLNLIIEKAPETFFSTKHDPLDKTALHVACVNKVPLQVLQILTKKVSSNTFGMKNDFGKTPLHIICSNKSTVEVVKLLIQCYSQEAYLSEDIEGRTPLHLALSRASLEVVELIVKNAPSEAYNCKDHRGFTPFGLACFFNAPSNVLKCVAMAIDDTMDRTALHLACSSKIPFDVLQILCEKFSPEIFVLRDDNGIIPLQIVCANKSTVPVVKLIAENTPQRGFNIEDNEGCGPIFIALKWNSPTVVKLVRKMKNIESRSCNDYIILDQILGKLKSPGFIEETMIGDGSNACITKLHMEKIVSFPMEIFQLAQLKEIKIRFCNKLEKLPLEIGQLSELSNLKICDCDGLLTPPDYIQSNPSATRKFFSILFKIHKQEVESVISNMQLDGIFAVAIFAAAEFYPSCRLGLEKMIDLCEDVKYLRDEEGRFFFEVYEQGGEEECDQESDLEDCNSQASVYGLDEEIIEEIISNGDGKVLSIQNASICLDEEIIGYHAIEIELEVGHLSPQIGQLSFLRVLEISNYNCEDRLRSLPPEIGLLSHLTKLVISDCPGLKILPPEIGQLTNLIEFSILRTVNNEVEHMKTLPSHERSTTQPFPSLLGYNQSPKKYHCLELLPPEVGNLKKLQKIDMNACDSLRTPPKRIQNNMTFTPFFEIILNITKEDKLNVISSKVCNDALFRLALFAAAEFYPLCANGLARMVKEDNDIVKLKDIHGRILLNVACQECKAKMSEEILFAHRYKLDTCAPIYQSPTCKVYFATDYSQDETGKSVAMKFVTHKKYLQAELDARYTDEGEVNFKREFVIASLHYHDDADVLFSKAAAANDLPCYCLVMERGDTHLLDAINNQNILRDITCIRPILYDIAKCLDYLHSQRSYMHGDLKPKNIMRDEDTRSWRLVDFEAATPFGKKMGAKVSTAYMPPEIIQMGAGNMPILKVLCEVGYKSNEIEVLEASASIDAWSYGVLMFYLLTGHNLHNDIDGFDNIKLRDIREFFANYDKNKLESLLARNYVIHEAAKELLFNLLDRDPEKRPTMANVLNDPFFIDDEATDNHSFQEEFQYLKAPNRTSVVTGMPNHMQYELDLKNCALQTMRCVTAISLAQMNVLMEYLNHKNFDDVVKWYGQKLEEIVCFAREMRDVAFASAYYFRQGEFTVLIIASNQLLANKSLFQENMKQLTRSIAAITYDHKKHDPHYPETYLHVGAVCHSEAVYSLANEKKNNISLKEDNSADGNAHELGCWENWFFCNELPNVEKE